MFPWLSFLSYIIIVSYTPGPNNIMVMNSAGNIGFRKTLNFIFGIVTGFFFVMLLCMLFSAFLYNIVPKIQFPMKILGALYMLYLVIKTLIPGKKTGAGHNNRAGFFIGMVLQFINAKGILYGISAMSSYILPFYNEIPVLLLFVFLLTFVGFTGVLLWALFGSLFSALFSKHGMVLNIIMALLLLYCIISLFI